MALDTGRPKFRTSGKVLENTITSPEDDGLKPSYISSSLNNGYNGVRGMFYTSRYMLFLGYVVIMEQKHQGYLPKNNKDYDKF